jgi:hypothetical protein
MDLSRFEVFTSLRPRSKPIKSDAPKVTLAKGSHNALYFNAAASEIIRSQPLDCMRPAVVADTMQGALLLCDASQPGALPMVESAKGRKGGDGTYQVGQVREFFEHYGLRGTEQHVFDLEWDAKNSAFLFHAPFILEYFREKRPTTEGNTGRTGPSFNPVEIRGEPLSKTVLDDRR